MFAMSAPGSNRGVGGPQTLLLRPTEGAKGSTFGNAVLKQVAEA